MKKALCINTADLNVGDVDRQAPGVYPIPEGFFDLPTRLIDREICEKDESTLQLLPYIVLKNEKGEFFSYHRGGAGEESRLHSKISIGLGGHVDIDVASLKLDERYKHHGLHYLLAVEAARELLEEVGLTITFDDFRFEGLIIDRTDEVGRVHLGILTSYTISNAQILTLEKGVIEKGEFLTLDKLFEHDANTRLEGWSTAALQYHQDQHLGPFRHRAPTISEKAAFLIALGEVMLSYNLIAGAALDGDSNNEIIFSMMGKGIDHDTARSMLCLDLGFLVEAIDANL